VWYRGERWPLTLGGSCGHLAEQTFPLPAGTTDWRPLVEAHLRRLADAELPRLVREAADRYAVSFRRVAIRSQRTRWGSCSRRGTISLNWRLVQAPPWVRDYLIAHELAHLREMNHSRRYWRVVQEFFPAWREAEQWLKRHGRDLLG
jgi:predicted metal-dependent hydrolase